MKSCLPVKKLEELVPKVTITQLNSVRYKQKDRQTQQTEKADTMWILQFVELAQCLETLSIPFKNQMEEEPKCSSV